MIEQPCIRIDSPIIQPNDDDCLPSVMAMVVDKTVDQYKLFVRDHSPFGKTYLESADIWLAHHGLYKGSTFTFDSDVYDRENVFFKTKVCLDMHPALASVPGDETNSNRHAVYWDTEKIVDPSPDNDDFYDWTDKEIQTIQPIFPYHYEHEQKSTCVQ